MYLISGKNKLLKFKIMITKKQKLHLLDLEILTLNVIKLLSIIF
jgi:hypothetical protein